jgi:predicted enzyme related to lactoylglutathione lyase
MSKSRLYSIVVDSRDVAAQARFWSAVLQLPITYEADDEAVVSAYEGAEPELIFGLAPDEKTVKNRVHIDLAPDDRDAEVERIVGLGATRVDVGQTGEETWVVLADPEGNEFCVLSAR